MAAKQMICNSSKPPVYICDGCVAGCAVIIAGMLLNTEVGETWAFAATTLEPLAYLGNESESRPNRSYIHLVADNDVADDNGNEEGRP